MTTNRAKSTTEATWFAGLVICLSYFVFWGPIAVFKVPAASLVGDSRGPIWAIVLFMLGGFVPSVTAIVMTFIGGGRADLRRLFKSAVRFSLGWQWYLAIVGVVLAGTASQIVLQALLGHAFDFSLFVSQLPSLALLLFLGPLSEEFGWRGYLLPRLRTRFGPAFSSLVVGVIWAAWHVPLFLMVGTSQHELGLPFVGFAIGVISTSVIITWLNDRTSGSLWTAILFHWLYTYTMQVVAIGATRSSVYNWLEYAPYLLMAFVVLFVHRIRHSEDGRATQRTA